MPLSESERRVLEGLGRDLVADDPVLASRLGWQQLPSRRRDSGLAAAAAGLPLLAGVLLVASFPHQGPEVGAGCILIVVGMSVASAVLPARLTRRWQDHRPESG